MENEISIRIYYVHFGYLLPKILCNHRSVSLPANKPILHHFFNPNTISSAVSINPSRFASAIDAVLKSQHPQLGINPIDKQYSIKAAQVIVANPLFLYFSVGLA
jgi:hypothetical protein